MFSQFDEDENGHLSKGEMAQFIKLAFNPKNTKQVDTEISEVAEGFIDKILINVSEKNSSNTFLQETTDSKKLQKRKESMKSSKNTLKMHLKNYDCVFSKDLDEMWTKYDNDGKGYLDKKEAQPFLDEVAQIIEQSRAKSYVRKDFNQMFEEFDEDKNGFLSKNEMAILIKKTFKKQQPRVNS